MLLRQVVETSRTISETSKRTAKIAAAADLLRQLAPDEVQPVAAYLSGVIRQGRVGVGYATVRDAMTVPAEIPSITVAEFDEMLTRLAQVRGTREKLAVIKELMTRATEQEQRFVMALLVGEFRQGALEGLMVEALAKAVALPADRVRRAVMMAGDFATVAKDVLTEGEDALTRYDVQLFRLCSPCSRRPQKTRAKQLPIWEKRRWSTSWMVRAYRCTGQATTCACTRVN